MLKDSPVAADLSSVAIPFAILCALALAGVSASLFSFVYTKTLVDAASRRTVQLQARLERALQDDAAVVLEMDG